MEQPKNKRGNKSEAVCISSVFNRETFLLNKTPKSPFCVAPIVTNFLIQTCPETLKRGYIDQESASRFQFLANISYGDRIVMDMLKDV